MRAVFYAPKGGWNDWAAPRVAPRRVTIRNVADTQPRPDGSRLTIEALEQMLAECRGMPVVDQNKRQIGVVVAGSLDWNGVHGSLSVEVLPFERPIS